MYSASFVAGCNLGPNLGDHALYGNFLEGRPSPLLATPGSGPNSTGLRSFPLFLSRQKSLARRSPAI